MNVQSAVLDRYSKGAQEVQPALCCPASYDETLLALLPQEIIDKDYGCGDPSRYVRPGDVVLDLGSGAGKICYLAAQLVGEAGGVIGVDMNDAAIHPAAGLITFSSKALVPSGGRHAVRSWRLYRLTGTDRLR